MVCSVGMIQPTVWIVWLSDVAASHFDNSASAACIAGLLLFRHEAVGQFLAVWQPDLSQAAAELTVAQRRKLEGRVIADLQRALVPAGAGQNRWARDLEDPGFGRLAILGVEFDYEGDVRVGPVDLLYRPFHDPWMFVVIGGTRMVRRCGAGETQHPP